MSFEVYDFFKFEDYESAAFFHLWALWRQIPSRSPYDVANPRGQIKAKYTSCCLGDKFRI